MGDCTITIHVRGSHHNKSNPSDIARMADRFVADLKKAGHAVHSASITSGGRQELLGTPADYDQAGDG
jgi:hypothetical protein